VAEDGVQKQTVSRPVLPAICDLQGDFHKLQGEPTHRLANFLVMSICCEGFSLLSEQGAFFGICREKQRGIANGGRVGADFHFALVGLKEWRQGPAARLPALRLRTVRKESGNAFWCRPSTAAIAAGQTIQRE
jgi:hypothetical protein